MGGAAAGGEHAESPAGPVEQWENAAMSNIPAYGAVDLGALAAAREAQAQAEQRAAARAAEPEPPAAS